jgi:hypothetical protein
MNKIRKLKRWFKILQESCKLTAVAQEGKGVYRYYNEWMEFYPDFYKTNFKVSLGGYFDGRLRLIFCIIWGQFYIKLPFVRKIGFEESEPPSYGFNFYSVSENWIPDNLIIYFGRKTKFISLPWELVWYRTSMLLKDGTWEHEIKNNERKDFWMEERREKFFLEQHYYINTTKKGKRQKTIATISVKEREWRPLWFGWTKVFAKVKRTIDVEFAHELGMGVKTYKGGITGVDYEMILGETPEQTLRRMEKEKKID